MIFCANLVSWAYIYFGQWHVFFISFIWDQRHYYDLKIEALVKLSKHQSPYDGNVAQVRNAVGG